MKGAVPSDNPGPHPSTSFSPVRFAALGDSFTEGVGDPVPGGRRGWAALLAEGLADSRRGVEFRNFAVSGAQSGDVLDRQAAAAAAFRPHLVSVVVGVNDTLRRTFDIRLLARRLDPVCALLTESGAVLLTACLPDPGAVLGLPAPLGRPLARRQAAVNAVVHALSERYDAVHLHMADRAWVRDRSLWSADRLHPAERGHRTVAAGFHELLAARGLAHGATPGLEAQQPPPSRADTWFWLATAGTGRLARRSTDLLPQLLCLAGAEVGHRVCGTGRRPARRAEAALRSALAAVAPIGSPAAGERAVPSGPLPVPRGSMEG
ncbi:SGNH/GDSL hydrolase family protein [Streptomyces sp. Ncost-T10-10d]|uniref:SGNH/GDSL hydrolase family protein n=1 Tax=Streptomyces sp. Ncost-T10-10d TaxID=1839774 RepID=UPI00081F0121|nr:SGNH/GDSL hydrolase family protein [Streptomyces sp. Ncost-T10-10d]SCF60508.1 Lysophospholipase L1 [Streptomyces sp. Ncost-T10-10d]